MGTIAAGNVAPLVDDLITAAGIVARDLTGDTVRRELARADANARGDAEGKTATDAMGEGDAAGEAEGDICRAAAAWPTSTDPVVETDRTGAELKSESGRTSMDPAFEGGHAFRSSIVRALAGSSIVVWSAETSTASNTELSLKPAGVDRLLTGLEDLACS